MGQAGEGAKGRALGREGAELLKVSQGVGQQAGKGGGGAREGRGKGRGGGGHAAGKGYRCSSWLRAGGWQGRVNARSKSEYHRR